MKKMRKWIALFFILMQGLVPSADAEEEAFSKLLEVEKGLSLKFNEIYDSEVIDVSGYRKAYILIEPVPAEKLLDQGIILSEPEINFTLRTFFYLQQNVQRSTKKSSSRPLVALNGFEDAPKGQDPANLPVIKNRTVRKVDIQAPYLVLRLENKSSSMTKKIRVAVFLRK